MKRFWWELVRWNWGVTLSLGMADELGAGGAPGTTSPAGGCLRSGASLVYGADAGLQINPHSTVASVRLVSLSLFKRDHISPGPNCTYVYTRQFFTFNAI